MKRYALLGRSIGYSRSPIVHAYLARVTGFDMEYGIYQTEEPESVLTRGLDGFNVTIPYKQALLGKLSRLDPVASRIGAVNTVKRTDSGWAGFNTDYEGFGALLERAGIEAKGKRFAILGTGGAARGAAVRLVDEGAASVSFLSRNPTGGAGIEVETASGTAIALPVLPYAAASGLGPAVYVNATPLGTDPNEDDPMPVEAWDGCLAAVDLVYNPFLTPFLRGAVSRGIPSADGLDMLAVQAVRAFEIWSGEKVGRAIEDGAVEALRLKASAGLALVGMPFSGKSTLLASLSPKETAAAGARPADLDDCIEKSAGASIPAIFASEGEEGFRRRERDALSELSRPGHLIACGGGALTKPDNLAFLRNSLIIQLDVPLDELKRRFRASAAGSRPLLRTESDLEALYARRSPVYRSAARAIAGPAEALGIIRRWLEVHRCA